MDEAFCNADHLAGQPGEAERIHVEFSIEKDSLVVSIREKGIPFGLEGDPGSQETLDKPGLGGLLMLQAIGPVEFFIHGREGKEVRLRKKLAYIGRERQRVKNQGCPSRFSHSGIPYRSIRLYNGPL